MLEDAKEDEKRLIEFGDIRLNPIRLEYLNPKPESANFDRTLLDNLKFENIVRKIRSGANYNVENYEILGLEITRILDGINQEINSEQN